MAPKTGTEDGENEVELGRIELPYGARVTQEVYGFRLNYQDTNLAMEDESTYKYLWTVPKDNQDEYIVVPVCPDRNPDGAAAWTFKGWALGPAGANMLWPAPDPAASDEPQAQVSDDFPIGSDVLLYAIWEAPLLTVTFHLNGGEVDRAMDDVTAQVPANQKLTDSDASIPRPFRSGYTMEGWYQSDEAGRPVGTDEEDLFNFDEVIIRDQHVAAVWSAAGTQQYSYNVYYVTPSLREGDEEKDTVLLDDGGGIVEDGGTAWYVLGTESHTQVYAENTALNLTARGFEGYTPRETNRSLALDRPNETYDIIFRYDPQTTGSYTVRFVEAGTEALTDPTVVYTSTVSADQVVVTPSAAAMQVLAEKGYQLANRDGDGYTAAESRQALTWLDTSGNVRAAGVFTGANIPAVITYLVQPIPYSITYRTADGAPTGAAETLSAVTAAENTPVGSAEGKNPTQYTAKDSFTLKNPGPVFEEGGKWRAFSHWSLGEGTAEKLNLDPDKTYPTLQVDPGTVGSLIFVAHWEETAHEPATGGLKVSKTVSGSGAETGREFSFTVTLNSPTLSGTYGGMAFIGGVARFTLKHGESVAAEKLPAGLAYTVTETAVSGYTAASSGAAGVITADQTQEVVFTNTRSSSSSDDDDDEPKLNTEDHYSYIIGFQDGTVRPNGNITRGEVATIFFRLLTDKTRDTYWSQSSPYTDCTPELWCNNAISTLTRAGILNGFDDGTFRPGDAITRAEFTKIAVGFFKTTEEDFAGYFPDVDPDAWYAGYVEAAFRTGLIQGREDGSFRPDAPITRAEACVIVNRALGRRPDTEHLLPAEKMVTWPDNLPGSWYYADVQEATNSHDYTWLGQGSDRKYMEKWTGRLKQRDWAAFERAWSTAHSAPGGEVAK